MGMAVSWTGKWDDEMCIGGVYIYIYINISFKCLEVIDGDWMRGRGEDVSRGGDVNQHRVWWRTMDVQDGCAASWCVGRWRARIVAYACGSMLVG